MVQDASVARISTKFCERTKCVPPVLVAVAMSEVIDVYISSTLQPFAQAKRPVFDFTASDVDHETR